MFQPDVITGQPWRWCVRVDLNKEINVSKMMGSRPGCVYSRAELQSNDCLKYMGRRPCRHRRRNLQRISFLNSEWTHFMSTRVGCPLVVGGGSGPEALREAQGRARLRGPKRRLRREGRVRFCGYCTLGHKQFMCFMAVKLDSIGWFFFGNYVFIRTKSHPGRINL